MTGLHDIITGDCVEVLRNLVVPADVIDLVVADPPYNVGVDYGRGKKADRRSDYGEWVEQWIALCADTLCPGGSMWIISGQEHGAEIDIAMRRSGLEMRNRITWYESFGVYCHAKFARTSRPIFYAVKPGRSPTFNADAVRVPSARETKYGDKRAAPGGRIMDDVWPINRVCGTFRERVPGVPTQLPEALVRRIIEVSSNPGDTILDPFAGSGTTIAVAKKLGRGGVGIELSEEYSSIARRRIEEA